MPLSEDDMRRVLSDIRNVAKIRPPLKIRRKRQNVLSPVAFFKSSLMPRGQPIILSPTSGLTFLYSNNFWHFYIKLGCVHRFTFESTIESCNLTVAFTSAFLSPSALNSSVLSPIAVTPSILSPSVLSPSILLAGIMSPFCFKSFYFFTHGAAIASPFMFSPSFFSPLLSLLCALHQALSHWRSIGPVEVSRCYFYPV
uniref:Uncharacterized protein n=1 Tax=Elaeophora elaphi TaxID=1147741 RepID=A0A0R3S6W7_9BILA